MLQWKLVFSSPNYTIILFYTPCKSMYFHDLCIATSRKSENGVIFFLNADYGLLLLKHCFMPQGCYPSLVAF